MTILFFYLTVHGKFTEKERSMETRVFNFEDCTVRVHIPEGNQKVVEKATTEFLKRILERREVVNGKKEKV